MYHHNVVNAGDMHLDGTYSNVVNRARNAVTHTGSKLHEVVNRAVTHTGKKLHEAAHDANRKYHHWRHARAGQKSDSSQVPTTLPVRSNIDLCECSRRVQGHLAILYPELH